MEELDESGETGYQVLRDESRDGLTRYRVQKSNDMKAKADEEWKAKAAEDQRQRDEALKGQR